MKRRSRLLLRFPLFFVSALSLFSGPANAENPRVTEPTDFWFTYEEPTTFFARTFQVEGVGSDPMLWLYDSSDTLVAANDDYYGLQSHIQVEVSAGTYRLRAGVCCGDPNRWYQGVEYDLSFNGLPTEQPTTTTTSTVPETTTTTSTTTTTTTTTSTTTTTTVPETTTSTTTSTIETLPPVQSTNVPTTTILSTTTVLPTTTTTIQETTTTWPTTTTSVLTPTVTVTTTTIPEEPIQIDESIAKLAEDNLSTEEVIAIIEELNVEELTTEQVDALVEALNEASDEVKETFEEKVDIYSGEFDEYVPTGSAVPVKTRRVLVAVAGAFFITPTATTSGSRRK